MISKKTKKIIAISALTLCFSFVDVDAVKAETVYPTVMPPYIEITIQKDKEYYSQYKANFSYSVTALNNKNYTNAQRYLDIARGYLMKISNPNLVQSEMVSVNRLQNSIAESQFKSVFNSAVSAYNSGNFVSAQSYLDTSRSLLAKMTDSMTRQTSEKMIMDLQNKISYSQYKKSFNSAVSAYSAGNLSVAQTNLDGAKNFLAKIKDSTIVQIETKKVDEIQNKIYYSQFKNSFGLATSALNSGNLPLAQSQLDTARNFANKITETGTTTIPPVQQMINELQNKINLAQYRKALSLSQSAVSIGNVVSAQSNLDLARSYLNKITDPTVIEIELRSIKELQNKIYYIQFKNSFITSEKAYNAGNLILAQSNLDIARSFANKITETGTTTIPPVQQMINELQNKINLAQYKNSFNIALSNYRSGNLDSALKYLDVASRYLNTITDKAVIELETRAINDFQNKIYYGKWKNEVSIIISEGSIGNLTVAREHVNIARSYIAKMTEPSMIKDCENLLKSLIAQYRL